jgi:hypothetical protein
VLLGEVPETLGVSRVLPQFPEIGIRLHVVELIVSKRYRALEGLERGVELSEETVAARQVVVEGGLFRARLHEAAVALEPPLEEALPGMAASKTPVRKRSSSVSRTFASRRICFQAPLRGIINRLSAKA